MLRQTTAKQVENVYKDFVGVFQDAHELARADRKKLRAMLRSLGISSRVDNLMEISRRIESEHGGRVPRSYAQLTALPGVGPYVANSVLVRAYGQHHPLVDSNVNRVLARMFYAQNRTAQKPAEATFMRLSRTVKPERLNYAIIDLAHSVCTQRRPRCQVCPLRYPCLYAETKSIAERHLKPLILRRNSQTKKGELTHCIPE
jgi:A/G-specific adenine glycosylase